MHPTKTITTAFLIAVLVPLLPGHAADPATAPATAPATQPDSPRDAAIEFFTAASQGDRDAVMSRLWLVDDSAKKEADVVIGLELLKLQFDKSLTDVFAETPSDTATGTAKAVQEITTQLKTADVTVTGDTALVKPTEGPTLYMVRHGGRWQIDFVQMQVNDAGGREKPATVEAEFPKVKVYQDVITDVKAKKYKSADDARTELNRRLAPFTQTLPATTSPAKPPAEDTP